MRLSEISQIKFYHGSMTELDVGTVLKARGDQYHSEWSQTDFYAPLEQYRPTNMLSHSQSIFMCDNEDDVDTAGGGTDWLFTVVPMGKVQKHDMNWSSEISMLVSDGYDIDSDEIQNAANNYWAGVPHHNESLWEYLTPAAKVIHVEEY
jgi:hypothetical protein